MTRPGLAISRSPLDTGSYIARAAPPVRRATMRCGPTSVAQVDGPSVSAGTARPDTDQQGTSSKVMWAVRVPHWKE
jgi:hypothetical protein